MASTIRRKVSAALTVVAAVGCLGAAASSAGASDRSAASPDRWFYCTAAPAGSLVLDFDTINDDAPDQSICWSGSGRAVNHDGGELRQVHTANNRGSLHLKTGSREWDLPFDRNQTHDIPQDTALLGLSLNE
ncbi:hypothetical protein [Streptomyces coffeae]|uniref:Secreted protein n=1 Tax=Streptomyces coffeae TaxID=621382 RepID=A0ABS1NRG2_9ACTN|nr:hypothetical protein [Streptomyces coffeae]MBL1102663.1 hypothetical protein [Streptomyces coffeae]